MLNLLDTMIQTVLDTGWVAPPAKPLFGFSIPNDDWVTRVKAGTNVRLNMYLYEVRENREFRRANWDTIAQLGEQTAVLSAPPAYFDCHYLISAWSPEQDTDGSSPVPTEHQVLAEALRVLMRNPDLRPIDLGVVGGGPVFQQAHIYLSVAPPEGPRILNDFWSTMKLPWRPAIQLVATAPIDLLQDSPPVPLMTTLVQRYGLQQSPVNDFAEVIAFGGWVLRNDTSAPIPNATVERLTVASVVIETTTTDAQGRFSFGDLRRGPLRLRASGAGLGPTIFTLTIPDALAAEHVLKLS
jgi:hypothetical protein